MGIEWFCFHNFLTLSLDMAFVRDKHVLKLRKIKKSKCIEKRNTHMYAGEIYQNTKLFRVIPVKWIIDFGYKNIGKTKSKLCYFNLFYEHRT
jgi:hypothetical protein